MEKRQEGTETTYVIRHASAEGNEIFFRIAKAFLGGSVILQKVYKDATFVVKNGDYSPIMKKLVEELKKAKVCTVHGRTRRRTGPILRRGSWGFLR